MFRSKKKKYIGLFGGSFDPPHKGHLKISKESIKILRLNRLFWTITKKNPFKKKSFFSLEERIQKCKKITKGNKIIKVEFLEKVVKSNKTIDVVKYLLKKNKNSYIYLILGSDSLIEFHKWKQFRQILKLCKLVIFSRKGFDKKAKSSVFFKYLGDKKIIYIKNHKINISSSIIRKTYLE